MALKSNVRIETVLRAGRTVLQNAFCQPPFKIADVTEDRRQKALRLMLMSSSPGMLDGDNHDFNIVLGEQSSLVLETQSYGRLFSMKSGAVQTMKVELYNGSSFVYLPHPSVPHKNSVFEAKNKIFLNQNCSLVWGEVISCGRKMNDEVFAFTSYHSLTEIFLNNKLVVKENLLLVPGETNVLGTGQWEGFTHQATLLYVNEKVNVAQTTDAIAEELALQPGVVFGVSALPLNGLVVRLLGGKAEKLFALLKRLACLIQSQPKSLAHV